MLFRSRRNSFFLNTLLQNSFILSGSNFAISSVLPENIQYKYILLSTANKINLFTCFSSLNFAPLCTVQLFSLQPSILPLLHRYLMYIFLIFSLICLQTTPPHQTPSPSTPYRHIPLHTYSPAPKGVVKYDTLPLFPKKNYPFLTISRISLDKSPPYLYNI